MPHPSDALESAERPGSRSLQTLLVAVTDFAAQRTVLLERIEADPVGTSADVGLLVSDAMQGVDDARRATLVLASVLIQLRRVNTSIALDALRTAAARRGDRALAALLDDPPAHRSLAKGGRLAEVCIPERSELDAARSRSGTSASTRRLLRRANLPKLLAHPSPVLVGRLLDEPWIELRDVLRIASRRPTSRNLAFVLASHQRWIHQLEVRDALVTNPFVPTAIVLALLPTVRHTVIRHVAAAGDTHPSVALAAALCLELRGAPRDASERAI